MRLISKITNFFNSKQGWQYLLVFVIAICLFTYLHFDKTFADPDSFYHAKMPSILLEEGTATEFPQLSATTLRYNFIDHHFLYHLALIPFVKIFDPLLGLKIATIIFSSLTILTIFWFLRRMKVRGAFWYILFLLTINPFIFRLNLAKAQGLVLIFLFLIIYLIVNRRYLSLVLFSSLYIWLYGGWPLLLLLVFIYSVVSFLVNKFQKNNWPNFLLHKKGVLNKQLILISFSVCTGLLAGLFFSPYFPKNLIFYWQQSFQIAIFNYQHIIGVGGEWYPYSIVDLIVAALPFLAFFMFGLVVFVVKWKKQPVNSWFFLISSFLFFVLTLKSRRYVEYFVPITLCFSALTINSSLESFKKIVAKFVSKKFVFLFPIILLLAFSPFFIRDIRSIKTSYSQGFSFERFFQPSQWLLENAQAGEIVFHSDWDEFPFLFYHNDKNYYLLGLDPTFMYNFDPNLYKRWVDIVNGVEVQNLYPTIKDIFGASYVFVDITTNQVFDTNLANNFYFEKVFENDEAKIYKVN